MQMIKRLLAGCAVACTAVAISGAGHANEVVIATWGGTWGKAIQEKAVEPFEKETGIKVKLISGVSLANMQMIAAQRNNPQVDIIMMTAQDAVGAYNDGLLAPIDQDAVPSTKDLPDFGIRKAPEGGIMFAGMWMYTYGIAYRADKVDFPVACWKDLWDPRLKNKVAVSSPKYMNAYFMLMANKIADGTEENIAPGLERIKKMGQNLVAVADDSATQQRLLAQGEAWAIPMLSSAAHTVIDKGVPARFVNPCEGAPAGVDVMALVKNGPNKASAEKFINYYISPKTIAAVTEQLKITPVNPKAEIGPEHAKYTISKEDLGKLVSFSDEAIIGSRAKWQDQWEREISPMTRR